MKRFTSILALCALTVTLTTGCSSLKMASHADKNDDTIAKSAIYVGKANSEEMLKAIKSAGEKTGWRVTEFKSDTVIVEKIVSGESMSTTITFHRGHIYGNKEHASKRELLKLRKAIVEELESKSEAH